MVVHGSYSNLKNYQSNYWARTKFFTMPRPSMNVRNNINIDINNYGNYGGYNMDYTGMYANYGIGSYAPTTNKFLEWMMGISVVSQLFNAFSGLFGGGGKKAEPVDPEQVGGAEVPEEEVKPEVKPEPELTFDGEFKEVTEMVETGPVEVKLTEPVEIPPTHMVGDEVYYTGWATFRACCSSTDGGSQEELKSQAFRDWFRGEYIEGAKDIWSRFSKDENGNKVVKPQDFPKTFVYNNHHYTLNLEEFAKQENQVDHYKPSNTPSRTTEGNTLAKSELQAGTSTERKKYKNVIASVTVNGHSYKSDPQEGDNLATVQDQAKKSLNAKYTEATKQELTQEQLDGINWRNITSTK